MYNLIKQMSNKRISNGDGCSSYHAAYLCANGKRNLNYIKGS